MLNTINDLLWGPGTLTLLLGTGVFLTLRMHFLPWRRLGYALRCALGPESRRKGKDGVSPFSALMTTLAATIGTGNLIGVATALAAGGPGALVWMELSALTGMATTFSESLLAVKYRRKNHRGRWAGGPMYVMEAAFGQHWGTALGSLFALFAVGASLGIGGMVQSNAICGALEDTFQLSAKTVGPIVAILALVAILGGIRSISKITSLLVPAMTIFYLAAGVAVILGNLEHLPSGVAAILRDAFSLRAAAGGTVGFLAARWGVARGVFSNEAGLGSAGIAAAAADTASPLRQGYISMTGVFFDTIVLCTVTGLVICCSGVLGTTDSAGNPVDGGTLTLLAFQSVLGERGADFIALSIVLFAFSTILGWEYQGETAFEYLFRGRGAGAYRLLYVLALLWGARQSLDTVFLFSDICNALMAMPNLLCLLALNGQAVRAIRQDRSE